MRRPERNRSSEIEAIEATAAAWLAQRDEGPFTPEQARQFDAWRSADVRHQAAVARLERTGTALQQSREFRPEARVHRDPDLLRRRLRARRALRFPVAVATALAACLAIAAAWWVGGQRGVRDALRYATTVDGYERVTLADGSLLELNSKSEVTVHFTAAERRVRLVRGEAHFTVAKNHARPFAVEAARLAVRAVGTAFNVRLGANDVEVIVTEGRVEVNNVAAPTARSASSRPDDAASGGPSAAAGTMLTPLRRRRRERRPIGSSRDDAHAAARERTRRHLIGSGGERAHAGRRKARARPAAGGARVAGAASYFCGYTAQRSGGKVQPPQRGAAGAGRRRAQAAAHWRELSCGKRRRVRAPARGPRSRRRGSLGCDADRVAGGVETGARECFV